MHGITNDCTVVANNHLSHSIHSIEFKLNCYAWQEEEGMTDELKLNINKMFPLIFALVSVYA